jgi:gliding motility-associated-like protein
MGFNNIFNKKFTLAILLLVCCNKAIQAQVLPVPPNCPFSTTSSVAILGTDTVSCALPLTFKANLISNIASTDSYIVSSEPYTPWPYVGANSLTTITNVDDLWSGIIPLPFPFCFMGQSFNSIIVSSNGSISFVTGQAGLGNAWSTATWGPMPVSSATSGNDFDYVICGPHHDMLPNFGATATITYDVYGAAPCRAFVVSWDSVPYFSGACNALFCSQQIVLYENSNIIDNSIKYKPACPGWNQGIAYQGIQNNGTKAFVVPGRNGTNFTDTFSTWRYTPAGTGASSATYSWSNAVTGTVYSNVDSVVINLNPLDTINLVLSAALGCSGLVLTDTQLIFYRTPVFVDFETDVFLGCEDDTVVFTNLSTGILNSLWTFGDGTQSILTNPTHIYLTQNVYNIKLKVDDGICSDSLIKTVNLLHPIQAINVCDTTFCLNPPGTQALVTVANLSVGGGLISTFNFGDGTVVVRNDLAPVTHNYTTPGIYTFTFSIMDTLGCVDTIKRNMYVDGIPYASFTLSSNNICLGNPVFISDTVAPMALNFNWDFGDNYTLANVHDPQHNYDAAGNYNITLTSNYQYCPPYAVTLPLTVNNSPVVNIGMDTSYCPQLTGPIILSNKIPSSTGAVVWSTGQTTPSISVTEAGIYWLKITGVGNCIGADTMQVFRDCYLNIPNAFTPNQGDEINRYFMPKNDDMAGVTSYNLVIFNRWGEPVFETSNLESRGWDGKLGGKDQPMGVYIYRIKATFKNGVVQTYNGNVTLLR